MAYQNDSINFSNFTTSQGPTPLLGGRYAITIIGTFGTGSVTVQVLGPDGVTFVTAIDVNGSVATYTANAMRVFDIPPGQIKLLASGVLTAMYANITRVSN